jgi:hypothetical protein
LRAVRQRIQDARVEQLVEEQRVRRDLAREVVAEAADADQPLERRDVLVEEREIGRAAADRLDDAQEAREHRPLLAGPRLPHDRAQDARQQGGEPAAAKFVEPPEVAGLTQLEQETCGGTRVLETELANVLRDALERRLDDPETGQQRGVGRSGGTVAAEHHVAEPRRDRAARGLERRSELVPARIAHRNGQALTAERVGGERMSLFVGGHLQSVLDAPQELVVVRECAHGVGREQLRAREARQRGPDRGGPKA